MAEGVRADTPSRTSSLAGAARTEAAPRKAATMTENMAGSGLGPSRLGEQAAEGESYITREGQIMFEV